MREETDDRFGRAVFLDRDGVLNRTIVRSGKRTSPRTLAEVEMMVGAERGCSTLRAAGYVLVMVTNQPEIARGLQKAESLDEINRWLSERLRIQSVKVCPHDDQDGCDCRKPKPGMILEAAKELGINLRRSYLVGDRWRDIEAGRRAGCRTVLIAGDGEESAGTVPDFRATSLAEASEWILGQAER
jgi:D-glycero-D-manno-heptose 1,7-bisphosphate phosphatase